MRRENAMLKLGTQVEYANQSGRIVGRTIELQPKYDIMLANGTVRPNVREGDLVILAQPASQPSPEPGRRSGTLGTGDQPANSMEHEQTAEEVRNADIDCRR
jgi:hypothetical protein